MNIANIKDLANKSFYKATLVTKQHSPELFIGFGIASGIAAAVLACRGTLKASKDLSEMHESIDDIRACMENEELSEEYSAEDCKKDLRSVYIRTAVNVSRAYAPAIGLGLLSIASILKGYNVLNNRNMAISAAYAALNESFTNYRNKVIERFGEDVDKELKYSIIEKEYEKKTTDEKGNEKTTIDKAKVADISKSQYARFFDESSRYWEKDSGYNLNFLVFKQAELNKKLKYKGFITLNEVYEELGLAPSAEGQLVGWVYDEKNPVGDNYIDFGIFETNKERNRAFVNGYERTILLDFNVDGLIYTLISSHDRRF